MNKYGEPEVTPRHRKMLEILAKQQKNPILSEMAGDILAHRLTPRQAMDVDSYGAELNKGFNQYREWYDNASEDERREAELGRDLVDLAEEDSAEERVRPAASKAVAASEEDMSERETWMRRRPPKAR